MTQSIRCDSCTLETHEQYPASWFKLEAMNPLGMTAKGSPIDLVTIHLCPDCTYAIKTDLNRPDTEFTESYGGTT